MIDHLTPSIRQHVRDTTPHPLLMFHDLRARFGENVRDMTSPAQRNAW